MYRELIEYKGKRYEPSNENSMIELIKDLELEHIKDILTRDDNIRVLRQQDITIVLKMLAEKGQVFDFIKYKKFFRCDNCQMWHDISENHYKDYDNYIICETCKELHYEECPQCNKLVKKNSIKKVKVFGTNDYIYACSHCRSYDCSKYLFKNCRVCNELYAIPTTMQFISTFEKRNACYFCDEHYREWVYCACCGRVYNSEEDRVSMHTHQKCKKCKDREKKRESLKSYGYKPTPEFKTSDDETKANDFMGLEYETELSCNTDQETIDLAYAGTEKTSDFVYAKTDGSLSNGVEFVTHPITLKAWLDTYLDRFEEELLNPIKEIGIKSTPVNAGIHIHLNRKCLGTNAETRQKVIDRICYLLSIPSNYSLLTTFCKRDSGRISRWASSYSISNTDVEVPIRDSIYLSHDRYKVVNLCNSNTIEFRCFASTDKIKDIKAFLIFVYNVVEFCKKHSDKTIKQTNLKEVLTYRYPDFMSAYCTERGI